jgi:hypothetical protein
MDTVYKWEVQSVAAKPSFKDKHGNIRQNVVKTVNLTYTGKKGNQTKFQKKTVNFNITDLTNFTNADLLTKEQVLEWCFNKMGPKEKELTEREVRMQLDNVPLEEDSIILLDI